jgi:steroid delta-isomerase-like uncharacterized protein
MTAAATRKLIAAYYNRFNAQDIDGFLALLSDDVVHDISQGGSERGKPKFRKFLLRMNRCYRERAYDIAIMTNGDGSRAAAEFMLDGTYLATDGDFLQAKGQTYRLRVGAFFEITGGKVARISHHYNLKDWLAQVGG